MKCVQIHALRAALASGFIALTGSVSAVPVAWTGTAGDNLWHTPGNWSPVGVPTSTDDVTIDVAGAPTILFNATTGTRSVKTLVLNENLSMSGGKLTVVATADVNANVSFTSGGEIAGGLWDISGGSLSGDASLLNRVSDLKLVGPAIIQGDGTWIRFKNVVLDEQLTVSSNSTLVFDGDQTLAGGTLRLTPGSSAGMSPSGTLTVAKEATIRGAGSMFPSFLSRGCTLVNQGTIDADSAETLDIAANLVVNNGLIKTSGGTMFLGYWGSTLSGSGAFNVSAGTLMFRCSFLSPAVKNFTRTGGNVVVQATMDNSEETFTFNNSTGTWLLNSGTITGGSLSFADGQTLAGTMSFDNRLQDLTILGDVRLLNTGTWIRFSKVTFTGSLRIGSKSRLAFVGDQILSAGTIVMESEFSEVLCVPVGTLTIGPTAAIRGCGKLAAITGNGKTNIINQGLIFADSPNGDLLLLAHQITNTGTIRIAPTSRLRRIPTINSGDTFKNLGTIQIDANGTLQLDTAAPTNFAGGTLSIDIKGQPSLESNYGKVRLSTNAALALGGTLKLNLVDRYTESCGVSFPIVEPVTTTTGQTLSGTFAALDVSPPAIGNFQLVRYTPTSASYQVLSAADFNHDGFITFEDFGAFAAAFEEGLQTSDFNQDGFLTFEDFDAFVAKFEGGC